MRAAIAKALFDHWQRNVGQSAKLEWETISLHLEGVFEAQADAVILALYPTEQEETK